MNVNIIETKKFSKTSLGTGNFDSLTEGKLMYSNEAVKFPVPKKPANNECFDKSFRKGKNPKPSNTNKRKKKKSKK
jgi:hypothetical protein